MPEAVSSNSTPASEGQWSASDILQSLEDTQDSLKMLFSFAMDEIEKNSGSSVAAGFSHIYRRELNDLSDLYKMLLPIFSRPDASFVALMRKDKPHVWSELFTEILQIYTNVLRDEGHDIDPDEVTSWPEGLSQRWITESTHFYNMLMAELGSNRNPIIAGSYLPWLELQMRNRNNTPDASQVDRIISRLTMADASTRKAS